MSNQTTNTASQRRFCDSFVCGVISVISLLLIGIFLGFWLSNQPKPPVTPLVTVQPAEPPKAAPASQQITASAVDPLIAKLRTELAIYGWPTAEQDAIIAAYQADAVSSKRVTITANSRGWYDPAGTWASAYAPRWSEANLVAHLRDEYPYGADLMVIEANGRRYSILWDGCGGIEKIAIGVKPVPVKVVVRKVYTVHKPQPQRPAPDGVQMICSPNCK